tara:strand:+ start:263 stop:604 length:342 start_codon:yes stop_codon:yes gene_type:complete
MRHDQLIAEIERREQWNLYAPFPVYDTEVIDDLKKLNMITKNIINNEPITYCKTCLSIHIKTVELPETKHGNVDYCVPCGNTELEEAHIEQWEDLYEEKYGERFLTKSTKEDE